LRLSKSNEEPRREERSKMTVTERVGTGELTHGDELIHRVRYRITVTGEDQPRIEGELITLEEGADAIVAFGNLHQTHPELTLHLEDGDCLDVSLGTTVRPDPMRSTRMTARVLARGSFYPCAES
jgi:hypothetical protein